MYIRVHVLRDKDRFLKQETGSNNDLCAIVHSLLNVVQIDVGTLGGGLIVVIGLTVGIGILLDAFPSTLIKRFVINCADVGNQRDVIRFGKRANAQAQGQDQSQKGSNNLFH